MVIRADRKKKESRRKNKFFSLKTFVFELEDLSSVLEIQVILNVTEKNNQEEVILRTEISEKCGREFFL